MEIGFGAAKCEWMVPQTASKPQYNNIFAFVFRECSISSSNIRFK